jgi:hypothetical protein
MIFKKRRSEMLQSTLRTSFCLLALTASTLLARAQTTAQTSGAPGPGVVASNSAGNEAEHLPALLKRLSVEISKLRLNLAQQQLEDQAAQLERELQQAQAEQRQLQERERAFNQDIARLDQQLSQPTLATEERAGLEAIKAELAAAGLERLRAELQRIAQREAELKAHLEQAEQRWQELAEQARELKVEDGKGRGGNESENLPAWLKRLAMESGKLRSELQQRRLENQAGKVAQLERELQQAQIEQRQLQEQEQAFNWEIAELGNLAGRSTPAEGHAEAAKADLFRDELERLRVEQQRLAQREAELVKRLEREQQRSRELME